MTRRVATLLVNVSPESGAKPLAFATGVRVVAVVYGCTLVARSSQIHSDIHVFRATTVSTRSTIWFDPKGIVADVQVE